MAELNLAGCPICQAQDSLIRQARTVHDKPYVWYECEQCGSVLLKTGAYKWTYEKIGVPSMSYLLKQPLSAAELQDMLPYAADAEPEPGPEPVSRWPEPVPYTAPVEETVPAATAPFVFAPEPEAEPEPEWTPAAPAPEAAPAPRKAAPRLITVAIVGLTLCLLASLVALIVTMILNRQAATGAETGSLIESAVALAGLLGTAC